MAAKFERTGFVLRNVWPNVKHFANEQSSTFAHSSNESSFVRKNSRKAEAAAAGATTSCCSCPSASSTKQVFAHWKPQPRVRLAARPAATSRHLAVAAAQASAGSPPGLPPLEPQFPSLQQQVPASSLDEGFRRGGVSIDDLVQTASEKYELNKDFWGKYTDIPSMALASEKGDILQIIENFVLIHRKHVHLFRRLKNTVLRNLDMWSAADFAALCHAWAQLGFLHEDLCVAMAERVTATAHMCNPQEICWLMDAYATARCSVQSVTDEITKQTLLKMDEFTLPQLCLHASSFARLNLRSEGVFDAIAQRLMRSPLVEQRQADEMAWQPDEDELPLSARDVTLAAYSFAKLGFNDDVLFAALAMRAVEVIRNFTARDLQMFIVALVRVQHRDVDLLDGISVQAQRRIAQFSAESLALMLRSMAFFGMRRDPLFTRTVAQLPRSILTFRPADVTTLLNAFAEVQVHSEALFDVITPFILEKAPMFTPTDWLSALRGYSSLGHRDAIFLSALGLHLQASKLSIHQLCTAIVDCSRLSFSGASASLAEAAMAKLVLDGAVCPPDAAAQMYSALLLLGHTYDDGEGDKVRSFLKELTSRLREGDVAGSLSFTACANLCYAVMLSPPVDGRSASCVKHPVDALALAKRCFGSMQKQPLLAEGNLLLSQIWRALQLLPWNGRALASAARLEALASLESAADLPDPPAPYFLAAAGQLAPHPCEAEGGLGDRGSRASSIHQALKSPLQNPSLPTAAAYEDSYSDPGSAVQGADSRSLSGGSSSSSCRAVVKLLPTRPQGIFVAYEIRDALQELSSALRACDIAHSLVLDADAEAHISMQRSALEPFVLAHRSGVDMQGKEIAVLWGSTVHYVSGDESHAERRLSPAARFQVASLEATRMANVVVVPYWWWPRSGSLGERGGALVRLLWEESARR